MQFKLRPLTRQGSSGSHVYHLSARHRSGTSTRGSNKMLQATNKDAHVSSALPKPTERQRVISKVQAGHPLPPSRSGARHDKPPPTLLRSPSTLARARRTSLSLSLDPLLVRKSSFDPSRQTQVHDARPMFLHHARDAVPFRVSLVETTVATRAAFEDRKGAWEQQTREDGRRCRRFPFDASLRAGRGGGGNLRSGKYSNIFVAAGGLRLGRG